MIPAQAVEAALTVLRRDDLWELSDAEEARLILEAAAPYMLADAWDEGSVAGWVESGLPHSWAAENALVKANPYRTAK